MAKCLIPSKPAYETVNIPQGEKLNNAMTVMKLLLESDLGLKDYMSAAIVGNMYVESRWNPTSYTARDSNQGQSGGLCQWHDKVNGEGRFTNLLSFAKECGTTWQSVDTQVAFLITELKGKEKNALNKLMETDDIETATSTFCKYFERPKNCGDRSMWSKKALKEWNDRIN